jgi:type II secretory ATPase GspE/PulE/Tfp pilus assembly ATPase PilB-like protein
MSQSDFLSKAADYTAAFELIDVVFSLECCLRHQVLPLELFDGHLIVGMVNPKDKEAIQEISPLVNSLDYSFHIQSIDAQIHQLVLVAYLKQGNLKKSFSQVAADSSQIMATPSQLKSNPKHHVSQQSLDHTGTLIDIPPEHHVSRQSLDHTGTLIDIPPEHHVSQQSLDHTGTLIDIPPEHHVSQQSLDHTGTLIDIPPEHHVSQQSLDHTGTLIDLTEEQIQNSSIPSLHDRPTFIVSNNSEIAPKNKENLQLFFSEPQINNITEPNNKLSNSPITLDRSQILSIKNNYFDRPLDYFKNSPPNILWQELLSRILAKGIGRLYLQQHHNYGRIICSQDGIVQSSLDKVAIAVFEGVIKEIKMLAKLPLTKLDKPKKVAIQKFYNSERILLRIEFMIGQFGEEITLQVLRGQALQFYEQRQVSKNLDQAIYLGQKLEKTLKKMRICQGSVDTSDLSALKVIMRQVEKQLKLLES